MRSESEIVRDFLRQRVFAIIGASQNRSKFGNIVLRDLRAKGYGVIPINPTTDEVEGEVCYGNLRELTRPVDGIVVIVPPIRTERVVRDAVAAGITRVWMQPGAESMAAVEFCRANSVDVIYDRCIMVDAMGI